MDRKIALVTGSSSGLGLATSVALARGGARVFATMREPLRRGQLDAAAERAGVKLEVVRLDVTDDESVQSAVEQVRELAGPVDLLVNNAGVGLIGAMEDVGEDELRHVFETNFFGVVRVTRAVVPAMRQRRSGTIVNVSSLGGRYAAAGLGAYCAAKFAMEGFSDSLRRELSPFAVRVVVVQPGAVPTSMISSTRAVARAAAEPSSPYRPVTSQIESLMDGISAHGSLTAERVGERIARIATLRSPAPRYSIGTDSQVLRSVQALLPERVFDWAAMNLFARVHQETAGPSVDAPSAAAVPERVREGSDGGREVSAKGAV